jgi:hypothetical protein
MNSRHPQSWRAQAPSADFAGRTVAAILRDRSARRSEWGLGRRLMMTAAAAVLVAGGAWGWTTLPKVAPPVPAHRVSPPRPALPVILPAPSARPPPVPPSELPPKAPAVAPPLPRRKELAPVSSASSPDAGRRVILPRCSCQEGICDCLEEH